MTMVAPWVRLGMLALAAVQLVTGVWAVVDPSNWFARFPGWDPRLVAAEPPFNEHLATDAGAGFVATGVGLLLAAVWGRALAARMALVVFLVFAVIHFGYHLFNPAPGLTDGEDVRNVVALAVAAAFPLVLLVGTRGARA